MRPQSAILAALEATPATNGETAHDTSARRADGNDRQAKQRQLQAVVYSESGPARADQPWLAKLGLEPTANMRQCGNSLVLPLADAEDMLSGYVNITAKGEVRLPRGNHFPEGCFFLIGELPRPGQPARAGIVETLEDGLRHHDATGDTVLVAFSFRNMLRVRDAVQACYPGVVIQIVNRWNSPAIWGATESAACAEPEPEEEPPSDSEDSRPETAPAKPARRSAADSLLEQAVSRCTFFHDAEANSYGMFEHDGYWECHPVRGKSFRNWLRQLHFAATGRGMGGQALQDIIDALDARALFVGQEAPVFLRNARMDDRTLVIDLGDAPCRSVVITPDGWNVVERSPVAFRRTATMQTLAEPVKGGRIDELRRFLNIASPDFPLVVGWLLGALRGRGPYPLLLLQGEQGSGKSTLSKALRALLDPSTAPLKALPKTETDLGVIARNSAVVCLDNLSGLDARLSDALCAWPPGAAYPPGSCIPTLTKP